MSETIKSIIEWSEETFGDNITLEGQRVKFVDEHIEWRDSNSRDVKELADMAIVACSISRFSITEAMYCFRIVDLEREKSGVLLRELETAINEKMAINRKRKWAIGKGNFQHISEGEENENAIETNL